MFYLKASTYRVYRWPSAKHSDLGRTSKAKTKLPCIIDIGYLYSNMLYSNLARFYFTYKIDLPKAQTIMQKHNESHISKEMTLANP